MNLNWLENLGIGTMIECDELMNFVRASIFMVELKKL